jgi:hypothetical protein
MYGFEDLFLHDKTFEAKKEADIYLSSYFRAFAKKN